MTAHEFLKEYPWLPFDSENNKARPSNSTIWRWLERGSVIINGVTPTPKEDITFPIQELVFFPKGHRRTVR